MTRRFHQVALDGPHLSRFEDAHIIDHDPCTTGIAIRMVKDAAAAGHPVGRAAA